MKILDQGLSVKGARGKAAGLLGKKKEIPE